MLSLPGLLVIPSSLCWTRDGGFVYIRGLDDFSPVLPVESSIAGHNY